MKALMRNLGASLIAVTLYGCGGVGITPSGIASNRLPLAARSMADTKATIVIHWPSDRKEVATERGPRWISPSTSSIVVEVDGNIKISTIIDSPDATGKPAMTKTTIAVPIGQDTFSLTLYDERQQSTSKPVGNVLGSGTVVQAITANKPNVVNAAVAGVIGGIAVTLAPDQQLAVTDPKTGGFDFIGGQPVTLVATAQDADGNALVPQPADLTLQPSVSSTRYLRVTQPGADRRSHQFLVALTGSIPQSQNVAVVAQASAVGTYHAILCNVCCIRKRAA
jgi:hypothetical protein